MHLYKYPYKAVPHNVFLVIQTCYREAKHWNDDTEDSSVEDTVYRNSIFSIQQKDCVRWKFILHYTVMDFGIYDSTNQYLYATFRPSIRMVPVIYSIFVNCILRQRSLSFTELSLLHLIKIFCLIWRVKFYYTKKKIKLLQWHLLFFLRLPLFWLVYA